MGIGGVGGVNSVDAVGGVQGSGTSNRRQTDAVSKNIQNEITAAQRQRRELSSKEDLSADEKAAIRKELQQEISSLNTKLRQRQSELRKEKERKSEMKAMREEKIRSDKRGGAKTGAVGGRNKSQAADGQDKTGALANGSRAGVSSGGSKAKDAVKGDKSTGYKPSGDKISRDNKANGDKVSHDKADIGKTGKAGAPGGSRTAENKAVDPRKNERERTDGSAGISAKEMRAIYDRDYLVQKTRRPGAVIARMEDGVVILKSEIKQDEARGVNVDGKQKELAAREKRIKRAVSRQYESAESNRTAKKTPKTRPEKIGERLNTESAKAAKTERERVISTTNYVG